MDEQPRDLTEEIKRLQRCVNDLVSVLALPAAWSGGEPSQIVHTLLDALLRMLQLDLVYIRLKETSDQSPIETVRFAQSRNERTPAREVCDLIQHWLGAAPEEQPPVSRKVVGHRDIS